MTIKEPFVFQEGYGTDARSSGDSWSIKLGRASARVVPGSSWGTFTIAATIPIALFVGFYMYRLRRGQVLEASILGGVLTLAATFFGGWIATHSIGSYFNLTASQVTWSMAVYGFIAAVLPVWVLLVPRDYLSSFLKIGTIVLLVAGVLVANPKLQAPAVNHLFLSGGPTVPGKIFPFLFITIMCGAISGFHALVSSGTTPKMIKRESDARTIGYGAMLIEGLVGVVAMIAAATLPVGDWAAMNTDLAAVPKWHDQFAQIGADVDHLNVYEDRTQEALRGRVGGAVTLAVGMAHIFDVATARVLHLGEEGLRRLWKYWYHFAIMFEALFILTTIDAGTRIGRFLLQEMLGKIHPQLGKTDWWPGAIVSTALIVLGWVYFMQAGDFAAVWAMFGVANQMLAVIALAIVSVYLVNEGRAKYLWVTVVPMCVVMTTTSTAAVQILLGKVDGIRVQWAKPALNVAEQALLRSSVITASLLVAMLLCTVIILAAAAVRISGVGRRPAATSGFEVQAAVG
jgi:carbon starvation protein